MVEATEVQIVVVSVIYGNGRDSALIVFFERLEGLLRFQRLIQNSENAIVGA